MRLSPNSFLLAAAAPWPAVHPLITVLVGCAFTFVAAWYWRGHDARKAARAAELAAAALAAADKLEWAALLERVAEIEASNGQFVDREALEKRFGSIEDKHKLTATEVLNQHNTLHEYERKRAELTGEFRGSIGQLQDKVHALESMPGRVTSLETKLDNLVTQISDLKEGQRTLKQELREDMRGNKGEILAAIKDLKTHP